VYDLTGGVYDLTGGVCDLFDGVNDLFDGIALDVTAGAPCPKRPPEDDIGQKNGRSRAPRTSVEKAV